MLQKKHPPQTKKKTVEFLLVEMEVMVFPV